ncbi:MAG: hypothetical protein AUK29_02435 [Nitrospirae bacterium CG2_30_53_67]|nr:MAG: hypothetical protein AUK29_02435 [Nitrospirae bacterium CG2_30_53_67]
MKTFCRTICFMFFCFLCISSAASAAEELLNLQALVQEALKNNPELRLAESRWKTSTFRVPQSRSLPDPMFMLGYQNEGTRRYTYGEMADSEWMFAASQMFPFPGKLSIKEEMAAKDAQSLEADYQAVRLKTIARVKELYFDLFLAYRNIDIIRDKTALFSRVEDAAAARYGSGMAPQQELLMAQTEKYMLLEKEEMLKQKVESMEAMLNSATGREATSPLGKPPEPDETMYPYSMDELIQTAYEHAPEIKSRELMIGSAEAGIHLAEKEYYPDFTLSANLSKKGGDFENMVGFTTTINLPLYYKSKQRQGVYEAKSILSEGEHELKDIKLMVSSSIRDNYSMLQTAGKLMELYRKGLIPKTYQDFDAALAGYVTGKVEAITVISRLKSLLDYELLYWEQFVTREKAIARLESLTGSPGDFASTPR